MLTLTKVAGLKPAQVEFILELDISNQPTTKGKVMGRETQR